MSESASLSKRTLLICLAILAGAAGALYLIFSTEPAAERETATLSRAMLVEVTPTEHGDFRPVIVETGTVAPAREVQLAPEVSGRVVELHPDFVPGGFLEAGEIVLRIDAADYRNTVAQRENELKQAETELALEMGRQEVARRDVELLGDRLPTGDNRLALREPQLEAARTRVEAARAALEQARLDLERTQLRSPFDAQILSRSADLGSQIMSGTPVAEIVGVERYWVIATVAPDKLPFLQFPEPGREGAAVELIKHSAGDAQLTRKGRLYRLIGALEPNTRLARVVIEVDDPLGREATDGAAPPPLLVGEFLEVQITGRLLKSVTRVPADYLRKNNTIWVMNEEDRLEIRSPEVRFKDATHAYLASGLAGGERVVTSSLSRVTEGAELRLAEPDESDSGSKPSAP